MVYFLLGGFLFVYDRVDLWKCLKYFINLSFMARFWDVVGVVMFQSADWLNVLPFICKFRIY